MDAAGATVGGRPGVALLVGAGKDGKGAKSLYFLPAGGGKVEPVAGGLHEEVNALTGFDLDGDGAVNPVAGMPGVLFAPGGGGTRRVLESPNLDLRSVSGGTLGRPWIAAARAGSLELWGRGPEGLARQTSFPLPVKAERMRWGLRLTSPTVSLLPGEPALFAAGPLIEGRRRLQTLLLPADGSPATESWSLLPGNEITADRHYLRLDGAPVLAVSTFETIGLLARKRLRLFRLELDRSRKGTAPTFTAETDCPLWFPLDAATVDADGDGKQDLVVTHPGGMRGKEMLAAVYRGLGGGRFDPKPRSWKLNAQPTDWLYGPEMTGDGVPDLLVLAGDRLSVYAGDPKGSRPFAGKPARSFPIPGAPRAEGDDEEDLGDDMRDDEERRPRERHLRAVDLPGGGRAILVRGAKDGKTVLTVVR